MVSTLDQEKSEPPRPVRALSADEQRALIAALPVAKSTGQSPSSYRKHLIPLAVPTDNWIGIFLEGETTAARDSFVPLIRVTHTRPPSGEHLGRLFDLLFLVSPARLHKSLLDLEEGRGGPQLLLLSPLPLPVRSRISVQSAFTRFTSRKSLKLCSRAGKAPAPALRR
jgi:hypothetical protein